MRARAVIGAGVLVAVIATAALDARSCPIPIEAVDCRDGHFVRLYGCVIPPGGWPYNGSAVRADVVLVLTLRDAAIVSGIFDTIGDWAFVLTGSRLGLDAAQRVVLQGTVSEVLKGQAPTEIEIEYVPPPPAQFLSRPQLKAGRRYLVTAQEVSGRLVIDELVDVDREQRVLGKVRRDLACATPGRD